MRRISTHVAIAALLLSPALVAGQSAQGDDNKRPQTGQGSATTKGQSDRSARDRSTAGNKSGDATFVHRTALGNMAEMQLGQLASQKATSDQVKQFAERMVTDHRKAHDELKDLAESKNIQLPAELDARHKTTHKRLSDMSGSSFDRAYMEEMTRDHRQTIDRFQRHAKYGKDAEIKAYAEKTLPTLQEHMQQAEQIRKELGPARDRLTRDEQQKREPARPGQSGTTSDNPSDRSGSEPDRPSPAGASGPSAR